MILLHQDMCYQHKDLLHIDPALISSTSLAGLQQPSGVLLLEEGLLHIAVQDETPAKRSRGRKEIPPDTQKWVHLARYSSSVVELHLSHFLNMIFFFLLRPIGFIET